MRLSFPCRAHALAAGLSLSWVLLSSVSSAQEPSSDAGSDHASDAKRSSARQLATEASADYRAGNFQDAYDKFNRAFRLVEVPALGVWSARSLRQLNRLVEASERYRDVLKAGAKDTDPTHQQALKDARAELDELLPLIPNLTIRVANASAEDIQITLDGELVDAALIGVKQRVDPGKHEILGKRGKEVVTAEVVLAERDAQEMTLTFKRGYTKPVAVSSSDSAESQGLTPMQTTGVAGMAAGGAFLVAGVVTTVIALGKQSDLETDCPGGECPPEFHANVDSFNNMKTLSTLSLIGAGVFGAAGVTLYVVGTPHREEPKVSVQVRSNGLLLRGHF